MSIEDLSKISDCFKGNEWCNNCREWYKDDLKECPECKMDDLDFELQFCEIDASIMEEFETADRETVSRPEWWQVSIGAKEATSEQYEAARVIYKQFIAFQKPVGEYYSGKSFEELLALFTQAKINNRL